MNNCLANKIFFVLGIQKRQNLLGKNSSFQNPGDPPITWITEFVGMVSHFCNPGTLKVEAGGL